MSWSYNCPKCKAILSPDSSIILCGSSGGSRILIGFHPEPGNYEAYLPPDTSVEEGELWDFFCPVCGENLISENENLCALDQTKGDRKRQVLFSRVAGEKVTFVMSSDNQVEQQHGDDADNYLNLLMKKKPLM